MKIDKKSYLIDVPVKLNIWIRPECQRKQFEVIKKVRPSILFLVSDGGRNEKEWELINQNRRIFEEEIDWECEVYKIYEEHNNGLYKMAQKRNAIIWNKVEKCILLEDDQIPSVSFFRFCKEMLDKYEYDERINCICGMNHLGEYDCGEGDYFFSRQGSIWGIATWKRAYMKYYDFSYGKDKYIMRLLKQRTTHNKWMWKRLKGYLNNEFYDGHPAGAEFFIELSMYLDNQLQIIPKKNLIKNIGCNEDSVHSDDIKLLPRGIRKVFNMEIYELQWPLTYQKNVIPDIYYEKKRNKIMAYNNKSIYYYRRLERIFLKIRYGKIKDLVLEIKYKVFCKEK